MSVPEWAKSECTIDEAKNYLRSGNTVDFFELVTSNILREHPLDVVAFTLDLVEHCSEVNGASVPNDYSPKKVDDNRYLREKNVCEFLDEWILALLKERPETDAARMEFHLRYLRSLSDKKGNSNCASAESPADKPSN
uniref:Antigen 2 n=1 Tax=Trypanosoma congolense (strain IL3000) TaxID=1068625 RepID=G0UNI8_TRYCI|nr:conserved hypothetical protein [Trypanosoma congolense IL3000]